MNPARHGPRPPSPRGRGAAINPPNRFKPLFLERDADWDPSADPDPRTSFYQDQSQSVITRNQSPDLPFSASLNPYRGCEHGCAYCFARPTHEYLGFSAGLDFETRILVKTNAPALLRRELASRRWTPQTLTLSGVTDPYQPVERRFEITRHCLEILAACRHPVCLVTKNALITRDIDLLAELARHQAVTVALSITSLDRDLLRRLEPRTSSPAQRLEAIAALRRHGVPAGVLMAPVIPGLTDHEIPGVIAAAAQAGAQWAAMEPLRLPLAVADVFTDWLAREEPQKQQKILDRVRALHGGKLNDPRFGLRFSGEGIWAEQLARLFAVACRRNRLPVESPVLSTTAFRRPGTSQLDLFSDPIERTPPGSGS